MRSLFLYSSFTFWLDGRPSILLYIQSIYSQHLLTHTHILKNIYNTQSTEPDTTTTRNQCKCGLSTFACVCAIHFTSTKFLKMIRLLQLLQYIYLHRTLHLGYVNWIKWNAMECTQIIHIHWIDNCSNFVEKLMDESRWAKRHHPRNFFLTYPCACIIIIKTAKCINLLISTRYTHFLILKTFEKIH